MSDLISREEAFASLERIKEANKAGDYDNLAYWEIERWLDILPSAEKTREWIPCSERLPDEEKGTYWVCKDTEYQCECRWTNVNHIWTELTTNWHWHIMDIPQYTKVIAWMPLPEPYKVKK